MKKYLGFILITSFLSACAPKPEERPPSGARFDFGPELQDVELNLSNLNEQTKITSENWLKPKNLSAGAKLEFVENMYLLGSAVNSAALKDAALAGTRQFRQQYQPLSIGFEQSPYLEAVIGFAEKDAIEQVKNAERFVTEDTKKVRAFLDASVATYLWPQPPMKGEQAVAEIQKYLDWFVGRLPDLGIDPMIIEAIKADIPVRAEPKLKTLLTELEKIRATTTALQAIEAVENLIGVMGYELTGQNAHMMKHGRLIAEKVQNIGDAQDVLSVLIQIHRILDPTTSKNTIGKEAADLHDFITNVKEVEGRLKCLEGRTVEDCDQDGIGFLGKKMKILPEIKERGVAELKNRIDTAMRNYLLESLDEEIVEGARSIPQMMGDEIQLGAEQKLRELQPIKNNFRSFVKNLAKKWSIEKLPKLNGQIRGLEQSDLNIRAGSSGAELIGQGLFIKTRLLNDDLERLGAEERLEWTLEHINKLLALGGYKKSETETTRPITQPLDMKVNNFKMSLEDMLVSNFSFAVPDKISLASAYISRDVTPATALDVSVVGQARLLKGLAESVRFLKDWQRTSFDPILGAETIGQIYPGATTSLAAQKVFPKETLIALSIGNAAVILRNLLKELSPVFVLIEENRIIWSNKYDSQVSSPSAMAGVVSLVSGKRDVKVSSQDLGEYIVALADFHKAIEKIAETKSEKLNPSDELVGARSQIKLLVVALANFLSNKMKSSDGWIYDTFLVKDAKPSDNPIRTLTQFRAMAAMIRAYELTGLAPYAWTVKDLLYKLNKEAFDSNKAFYRGIENLSEGVEVLKTLKAVEPLLEGNSRNQVKKITDSWLTLVEKRLQ